MRKILLFIVAAIMAATNMWAERIDYINSYLHFR